MAREAGGLGDKDGNEYERRWLVACALRVLDGGATSLCWEPAGQAGLGIEATLDLTDGTREVCQCKIENGVRGLWTIADLRTRGVLDTAGRHTAHGNKFVFVSRDRVPELEALSERADRCDNDARLYVSESLSNRKLVNAFGSLCDAWGVDQDSGEQVSELLSRLQLLSFESGYWTRHQRQQLEAQARLLIDGDGGTVVAVLKECVQGALRNTLIRSDIVGFLESRGLLLRQLSETRVRDSLRQIVRAFNESISSYMIDGRLLARAETETIQNLLSDESGPRLVVVHGEAGSGKSSVLFGVVRHLQEQSIPCMPIRLDDYRPETSSSDFVSRVLGLPADPAQCLLAQRLSGPVVLVLDQLDAIRWTAAHASTAYRICRELVEAALGHRHVRVVLSCRTFDLEDDPKLRSWLNPRVAARSGELNVSAETVRVGGLSTEVIQEVLQAHGSSLDELTPDERSLLANPHCLYLWWTLRDSRVRVGTSVTKSALLGAYWNTCLARLSDQLGQPTAAISEVLDLLTKYLDKHGRLDAPMLVVADHTTIIDACKSIGLLIEAIAGRVRFSHQSYLDYRIAVGIAERAVQRKDSVVEWLQSHEQSLFRRDQTRQLLNLLFEQEPTLYASTVQEIMSGEGIRFHLQHLVLHSLRSAHDPPSEIRGVVLALLDSKDWRPHVLEHTVRGDVGWFEVLNQEGLWLRWLESTELEEVSAALTCARDVVDEAAETVRAVLEPFWALESESWQRRIAAVLAYWQPTEERSAFGDWYCALVRKGVIATDYEHVSFHGERAPSFTVDLLASLVERQLDLCEAEARAAGSSERGASSRLIIDSTQAALTGACTSSPAHTWLTLRPVVERTVVLCRYSRMLRAVENSEKALRGSEVHEALTRIVDVLSECMIAAGCELWSADHSLLASELESMTLRRDRYLERIQCAVWCAAPGDVAEQALNWLLHAAARFSIGTHEMKSLEEPAARLIARFAARCTHETYARVETLILKYHREPWELESVRYQLEELRELGQLRSNDYGKAQCVLLNALPSSRMSRIARARLDLWLSKFGSPDQFQPGVWSTGCRTVVSSIPRERLEFVSDRTWERIICGSWPSRRNRLGRVVGEKYIAEASHEAFSTDFGHIAKLQPERILRLACRIPVDAPVTYFNQVLYANSLDHNGTREDGLSWVDWTRLVERLFLHTQSISDAEYSRAVCRVVERHAECSWSADTVERLAWLAQSHPDPTSTRGGGVRSVPANPERDLNTEALNCVRGQACLALQKLLLANRKLYPVLSETARVLSLDSHPAVVAAACWMSWSVYELDPDDGRELLRNCWRRDDDGALASYALPHVLAATWQTDPELAGELIGRMVGSSLEGVQSIGSYWATVGYRAVYSFTTHATAAAAGEEAHRRGVAEALADLVASTEWGEGCSGHLGEMFSDRSPEVRRTAAGVFRKNGFFDLPYAPRLADLFCSSEAFLEQYETFFHWLEDYDGEVIRFANSICAAMGRLEGELSGQHEPARVPGFIIASDVSKILLRLYQESMESRDLETQRRSLDGWDAFLRLGIGGARGQLEKLGL